MPNTAIVCGILLVLTGLAGYVYGVATERSSITALIPAFFGIVIVALGVGARASDGARRHLMHGVVVLALLGFILTAGRLLMRAGELAVSPAVISQLAMALICLMLVIMGIRSFAEAR